MSNSNASSVIVAQERIPHFQKDFPLILFWSQKVVVPPLRIGFYQINELKQHLNIILLFIITSMRYIK